MLFKSEERKHTVRKEAYGGRGELNSFYAIPRGESPSGSKFKMVGEIFIDAGASIGHHAHDLDEEVYVILSGRGVFVDNDGTRYDVGPGDVTLTMQGQKHGLEALDEPLRILALIAAD